MPRHIRVVIEDDDYDRLVEVKGERTWRDALVEEFEVADE
jgi:hypothetical protein